MNNQKLPISGHICWMLVIGMSIAYWRYTYDAQQKAYHQIQKLITVAESIVHHHAADQSGLFHLNAPECSDLSRQPDIRTLQGYEPQINQFLKFSRNEGQAPFHPLDTSAIITWQNLYTGLLILADSSKLPLSLRKVASSTNVADFHHIIKQGTTSQKITLQNGLNFYLSSLWDHVLGQYNHRYQRLLLSPDTALIAINAPQPAVVGQPFRADIYPEWYSSAYPDSLFDLSINGIKYPVSKGQMRLPMIFQKTGDHHLDITYLVKDPLCGHTRWSGRRVTIQSMPR